MAIYVEIQIRGTMEELWHCTQTPDQHARWDLRFTDIEYLPRASETEPQQFLYATRIGFGLAVQGRGETVGECDRADGQRTSSLKFWSGDPKSLIREGAGYWQYVPTIDGLRFLTSYDYRVRFGAIGRCFDRLVFRPLIGWATAWSFDCLRLWIEKGIQPEVSRLYSLIHLIARVAVAAVWIYQGAVPKLLGLQSDELTLMQQAGIGPVYVALAVLTLGWLEVLFGTVMLLMFRQRWHFVLTIVLMILATIGVAVWSPKVLGNAFNPVSLNLLMATVSLIGLLVSRDLPTAQTCLTKHP